MRHALINAALSHLYADVLEAPHADLPRLVFADRLDETEFDHPMRFPHRLHAELIRLQIEATNETEDCKACRNTGQRYVYVEATTNKPQKANAAKRKPHMVEPCFCRRGIIRRRCDEIIATRVPYPPAPSDENCTRPKSLPFGKWLALGMPQLDGGSTVGVRRGFPEHLAVEASEFGRRAGELAKMFPLTRVDFTDKWSLHSPDGVLNVSQVPRGRAAFRFTRPTGDRDSVTGNKEAWELGWWWRSINYATTKEWNQIAAPWELPPKIFQWLRDESAVERDSVEWPLLMRYANSNVQRSFDSTLWLSWGCVRYAREVAKLPYVPGRELLPRGYLQRLWDYRPSGQTEVTPDHDDAGYHELGEAPADGLLPLGIDDAIQTEE